MDILVLGQPALWSILTWTNKKGNKWQIDEFFKTGVQEVEAVMKYAESLSINFPRRTALDFGCGIGRLTQALANYFDEVCGIDIAPSMIELANKYNIQGKKCHYILNNSNNLKLFDNNSLDFIYCYIVLQHMEPEYSINYIREFLRILAPGGMLIFQIPSEIKPLDQNAITFGLPDSAFRAQIFLTNTPSTMEADSQTTLFVKVKNVSDVAWPSLGATDGKYQIKLGNHWLDENEKIVVDDGRAMMPKNLEPGDEVELSLTITAPSRPGTYVLELDVVQEMVAWFKNKGSETARFLVKIVYPSIVNRNQSRIHSERISPKMEMHGVQKHLIIDLIEKNGGKLIDVQEDFSAGVWLGFRYCVTK